MWILALAILAVPFAWTVSAGRALTTFTSQKKTQKREDANEEMAA
jgi:hypothetical protein